MFKNYKREAKEEKERACEAEARALTHFQKLNKIELLIKTHERDKIPAIITREKIKEIIRRKPNDF